MKTLYSVRLYPQFSGRLAFFFANSKEQLEQWLKVHNWKWVKINDPELTIVPNEHIHKIVDTTI